MAGSRRFVQVLQLMGEHPLIRVRRAVEECASANLINAGAVIERVGSLAAIESFSADSALPRAAAPRAAEVQIPVPDLSQFDQLLFGRAGRDDSNREGMMPISCGTCVAGRSQRVLHLTGRGVTAGRARPSGLAGPSLLKTCGEDRADGRCDDRVAQDPFSAVAIADDGAGVRKTGAGRRRGQSDLRPVSAPLDRDRDGDPRCQRGGDPDQERGVSRAERLRHLRLQRHARLSKPKILELSRCEWIEHKLQLLPCRESRNGKNARRRGLGPGGVSCGFAGAVLHGGGVGQPVGEGAKAVHPGPVPGPTGAAQL